MAQLTLHRLRSLPEEEPLHRLALLEFALKPKDIVFIQDILQIKKLCVGFHDNERRRLCVVN